MRELLIVVVVLVASSAGAQQQYVCTKKNGEKIRVTDCRTAGPILTPTPSPAPTFSPQPTANFDCSGGTFVKSTPTSVQLVGRTYPYSESVNLCAVVPADTGKRFLTLSSVNHSNSSCNVMQLKFTSPTGKVYVSESVQPGAALAMEPGKWSIVATLQPVAACAKNYPFDFYLQWW